MGNYSTTSVKTWWAVETYTPVTDVWTSGNAIPAPMNDINEIREGTAQLLTTADGQLYRTNPTVAWNNGQITLHFHRSTVSLALITQLEGYLTNNTGLKITTQTGDVFEGYIEKISKIWIHSGVNQEYDLDVVFQQFDVDGV